MRVSRRVSVAGALVLALAVAPALAEKRAEPKKPPRGPEKGPVVQTPIVAGTSLSASEAGGFKMASDPSTYTSKATGGGAIVGSNWGTISDPQRDSERRIRKLIRRLG